MTTPSSASPFETYGAPSMADLDPRLADLATLDPYLADSLNHLAAPANDPRSNLTRWQLDLTSPLPVLDGLVPAPHTLWSPAQLYSAVFRATRELELQRCMSGRLHPTVPPDPATSLFRFSPSCARLASDVCSLDRLTPPWGNYDPADLYAPLVSLRRAIETERSTRYELSARKLTAPADDVNMDRATNPLTTSTGSTTTEDIPEPYRHRPDSGSLPPDSQRLEPSPHDVYTEEELYHLIVRRTKDLLLERALALALALPKGSADLSPTTAFVHNFPYASATPSDDTLLWDLQHIDQYPSPWLRYPKADLFQRLVGLTAELRYHRACNAPATPRPTPRVLTAAAAFLRPPRVLTLALALALLIALAPSAKPAPSAPISWSRELSYAIISDLSHPGRKHFILIAPLPACSPLEAITAQPAVCFAGPAPRYPALGVNARIRVDLKHRALQPTGFLANPAPDCNRHLSVIDQPLGCVAGPSSKPY
jgi:hypothetical protein